MSSISSSPCGDINHNYSRHLYKDSDPASGCLANAYQILPVSDLQIQINTDTLFSIGNIAGKGALGIFLPGVCRQFGSNKFLLKIFKIKGGRGDRKKRIAR